jgi:hypothetical protein
MVKDRALAQLLGGLRKVPASEAQSGTTGQDLVTLLREKQVEVHIQGESSESIQINIRRLVAHPLTVHLLVGTFFVSHRPSVQNMVSMHTEKVVLDRDEWVSITVPVVCANMSRDIPGEMDSFTVQRSPYQRELARLIPVLDKAGVEFVVWQAAVWIVTDNADYDQLGMLGGGFMGFGARQIQAAETVQAMYLVAKAGIDVTKKRIWRDRHKIAEELQDEPLPHWL